MKPKVQIINYMNTMNLRRILLVMIPIIATILISVSLGISADTCLEDVGPEATGC